MPYSFAKSAARRLSVSNQSDRASSVPIAGAQHLRLAGATYELGLSEMPRDAGLEPQDLDYQARIDLGEDVLSRYRYLAKNFTRSRPG